MPTREFEVLQEAKEALRKAVWAGSMEYADEGNFDDLRARDKFVLENVGETIKILEVYIRKTRPIQNNKRLPKTKNLFS